MAITVGPCTYAIIGPIIEKIWTAFLNFAKRVWRFIIREFLIPLFEFVHSWGILEILGYLLCFQFVVEGACMDKNE